MPEKPSWTSSTTSQLLVLTVTGYLLGSLALILKGGGTLEPIKWLIEIILPIYGVRTGANAVMRMTQNGGSHELPEAPASGSAPAPVA